ncbi:DDE-domain-containing protein [Gyrodon lividus]|nr:DDE-domain-containing protein [Gyrodon lividus]
MESFADLVGVPDDEHLGLSEGWLSQYKTQNGLKQTKCHGEAASALSETKLTPLVIRKAHKPCAFKKKTGEQLGFNYRNNAKAWMMATIHQDWLLDWDKKLRCEGRKILLLQDNFSRHIVPDTLTNILVENFEPNLTTYVQPNDQGIIHCFKAHYQAKFIHRSIDLYKAGITPTHVYDIDQLEGMSGILPPDTDPIPIQLTLPISSLIHATHSDPKTLNDLIQQAEDALLNPAIEAHQVFKATDENICKAVMDAKRVWEESAKSSDVDGESDAPVEPTPMCNEALQAALLLRKYTKNLDDPFTHKLETMLGLFG